VLLSMTGFGEAHGQGDQVAVTIELKSINSRYLKLNLRAPEGFLSLEPRIESILKTRIQRGTVQLTLRIDRQSSSEDYRINNRVLLSYCEQLEKLKFNSESTPVRLDALLALPGVVDSQEEQNQHASEYWSLIESVLREALENLSKMRSDEGQAMATDLLTNCQTISEHIETINERTGIVVEHYQTRLTERMQKLLVNYDVTVEASDVAREVGLFAERCDISEEIVRLKSHVDQFRGMLKTANGVGRKLDFLTQEMFREANTIGSKANDSKIAEHIIEIKAAIERIREMVQNVE